MSLAVLVLSEKVVPIHRDILFNPLNSSCERIHSRKPGMLKLLTKNKTWWLLQIEYDGYKYGSDASSAGNFKAYFFKIK